MTDIEIIRTMEKKLRVPLPRLDPGDIGKHFRDFKRGYSLDSTGAVAGLGLVSLFIKPVLEYVNRLRRVTGLNVFECELEQGDIDFLCGRGDLTYLNIGYNKGIKDFSFLRELKGLTSVALIGNNLTDVSFLRELKGLTSVDLRGNNLTDVSFLRELKGLTSVDLGYNNLSDVSFLRELKGLTSVYLSNNKLTDISFVADLEQLADLYIDENPIENPPPEIVKQGLHAIRDYFRSLKEKELCRLNEVKILLVGSGGAGKTSLLKRLSNRDFDPHESKTHGIGIHTLPMTINLPGQAGASPLTTRIHAHFWDFGGQEVMHASHQFFLSKRSLYILVVDSREEQSPGYWLKHIETFGGSSPVLVVINKIDQNPHFDLDRFTLKRKYPNILDFYRISCLTGAGLPGIRDAVHSAVPQTELLQTPVAASWMKVKAALEEVTQNQCYISHSEFHAICDRAHIPTDTSRETLVQFLNELGVVLHFKDFGLQEYHVLNPRWVTEGGYRIINSQDLAERHGLLKTAELGHIINEEKTKTCEYSQELANRPYSPGEQNYLVKLMQKFELCYLLDEETILVPALLDTREPLLPAETRPSLDFISSYDFLPKSVISRLLVKLHQDLKPGLCWRTGMVLENELFHTRALIRADEVEKIIEIRILGEQKREHLSVIRGALREINRSFQQMKIEELIPLPLPIPAGPPGDRKEKNKGVGQYARTVSYSFLLGYERNGISEYFDGETGQRYRVAQLLDTVAPPEERKREGFDYEGFRGRFPRSGGEMDMPGDVGAAVKRALVSPAGDGSRYEKLKELVLRIETLGKQAAEARKKKEFLDGRALGRVRRRFVLVLGIDILVIAVFFLLLFTHRVIWGDIEPYTYIAGLVLFAINLGYLAIKGHSFSLTSIYRNILERERENFYRRDKFDAEGYAGLEKELEQATAGRDKLL